MGLKIKSFKITEELKDLEPVEINEERFNAIKNADVVKYNMFIAGAYYDVYFNKTATIDSNGVFLFEKLLVQAIGDNETTDIDMTLTPINITGQYTGSGGILLLMNSLTKSIPTILPNTTKTPTATLENLTIDGTTYSIPSGGSGGNTILKIKIGEQISNEVSLRVAYFITAYFAIWSGATGLTDLISTLGGPEGSVDVSLDTTAINNLRNGSYNCIQLYGVNNTLYTTFNLFLQDNEGNINISTPPILFMTNNGPMNFKLYFKVLTNSVQFCYLAYNMAQ